MPKNDVRVYMDIKIGATAGGRVIFELFTDVTPRAAENFRGLCTGEYGTAQLSKKKLTYENTKIFRVKDGFMMQGGDFISNDGRGNESVFGGTFKDESMMRKHTCAGLLSMANNGRHTNGSQFFITLKAAPQLNGKHVNFGKVVGGMDVIRAIGQVPRDAQDRPRVDVVVVGCGELDKLADRTKDGDWLVDALSGKQDRKRASEQPKNRPMNERASTNASAMLRGEAQATIPMEHMPAKASYQPESIPGASISGDGKPKSARAQKLMELRLKMNAGRRANDEAVLDEQKRAIDPMYMKRKYAQEKKQEDLQEVEKIENNPALRLAPKDKDYMLQTAEYQELKDAKKRKKNPTFGWDVFNQDAILRAHEKRVDETQFQIQEYESQKDKLGDQFYTGAAEISGHAHKPTEEAKDRLAAMLDKAAQKRSEYSRRRMHVDDEDVNFIHERNRVFNKKLDRAYNDTTKEIRANLERAMVRELNAKFVKKVKVLQSAKNALEATSKVHDSEHVPAAAGTPAGVAGAASAKIVSLNRLDSCKNVDLLTPDDAVPPADEGASGSGGAALRTMYSRKRGTGTMSRFNLTARSFEKAGEKKLPSVDKIRQASAVRCLLGLEEGPPNELKSILKKIRERICKFLGPPPVRFLMDGPLVVKLSLERVITQHYLLNTVCSQFLATLSTQVAMAVWVAVESLSRKNSYFGLLASKSDLLHFANCRVIYDILRHQGERLVPVVTTNDLGFKEVEMDFGIWEVICRNETSDSPLFMAGTYDLLAAFFGTCTSLFCNNYVPIRGRKMSSATVAAVMSAVYRYARKHDVIVSTLIEPTRLSRSLFAACEALIRRQISDGADWTCIVKVLPLLEFLSCQEGGAATLDAVPELSRTLKKLEDRADLAVHGSEIGTLTRAILSRISASIDGVASEATRGDEDRPAWAGRFQIWIKEFFSNDLAQCFFELDSKQSGKFTKKDLLTLMRTRSHPHADDAISIFNYLAPPPHPSVTLSQFRKLTHVFVDDPRAGTPPQPESSARSKKKKSTKVSIVRRSRNAPSFSTMNDGNSSRSSRSPGNKRTSSKHTASSRASSSAQSSPVSPRSPSAAVVTGTPGDSEGRKVGSTSNAGGDESGMPTEGESAAAASKFIFKATEEPGQAPEQVSQQAAGKKKKKSAFKKRGSSRGSSCSTSLSPTRPGTAGGTRRRVTRRTSTSSVDKGGAGEPQRVPGDPRLAASVDPLEQPIVFSSNQQQRQFSSSSFNPDKFSTQFSQPTAQPQTNADQRQAKTGNVDSAIANDFHRKVNLGTDSHGSAAAGAAGKDAAQQQDRPPPPKGSVSWAWEDFHSKF